MNFVFSRSVQAMALAATWVGWGTAVHAADMTLTPAAGGAVVIQSPAGAAAVRVQAGGDVQLPGIVATPATGTTAVCHDANGTLGRCDPSALAGTQGPVGPAGPAGPQGATGPAGAQGVKGDAWMVKATAEVAGANCATGGQRLDVGKDANANNVLDAGEISSTSYACNGAQGTQGIQGLQGPPGAGGVSGLTEVRHGCFDAAGNVTSGTGFSAGLASGVYTVSFNPAVGAGTYSLMLDGRTSTGRALALASGGNPGAGITLTPGWVDAGGESISRICFMLAR